MNCIDKLSSLFPAFSYNKSTKRSTSYEFDDDYDDDDSTKNEEDDKELMNAAEEDIIEDVSEEDNKNDSTEDDEPPNINKVAFRKTYNSIPNDSKLRLRTGKIVEDVIFDYVEDMDHEQ